MKVTTEKLPKSLVAVDVELDSDQVERGLDRAAKRLSEKTNIPGFRKGRAPRPIVERFFGREALLEEATDDLINKALRTALEQEKVFPVGRPTLETIETEGAFRFRVRVPVSPTVTLGDYRTVRITPEEEEVTDVTVERAMNSLRDKHVVLQELEEPRPAQLGDSLTVKLETLSDGEVIESSEDEGTDIVLADGYILPELVEGLPGINAGETRTIVSNVGEDHPNEKVRGKEVTFNVEVTAIKGRMLPEWEELTVLEEFSGTLDELREKTRAELKTNAKQQSEMKALDQFLSELVKGTTYDIPDVLIEDTADDMLDEQNQRYAQYGVTLDQVLQHRGVTREQARAELLPEAERQLKARLAVQEIVRRESLLPNEQEVLEEADKLAASANLDETQREAFVKSLAPQMRDMIVNRIAERKLRERVLEIITGQPAPAAIDATTETEPVTAEATSPASEETPA